MSDSDDALAPPPQPLSPEQILRRGILSLEEESSEAVERLVTEQQETYRQVLKQPGGQDLILQALLDRDRQLARTGREMASGRAATKMLREFVRGLLNLADYASVRRVGDATKTGQIEKVLEALGAEPADLRQLKQHGSTLGALDDPAARAEDLAEGRRKS